MRFGVITGFLAAILLLADLGTATAGVSCADKPTSLNINDNSIPLSGQIKGNDVSLTAEDCSGTKDLNGRVTDAMASGAASDAVIADPNERINLSLNAVTAQFNSVAFGGSAFIQPDMDLGLRVGVKGSYNPRSGESIVGVIGTYSFSPF